MQHTPGTVEEQLLLKAIKEDCAWENLPKRLQATLSCKEEWHRRIVDHCIKKRLQWSSSFARKVCKEGEYYEEMMRYLRKNLAMFPYHLAEYVCRVMRISPFRYYCDILFEVMKNEQPYDSIPNISAADCMRLTGIGRNEFIDIMNKCRSKKIMWKLNKSSAKDALPTQPMNFPIEPWWGICLVNFTLEEFKKLSEEESATIDKICKEEANAYILFDPEIIRGLYRRGLIYFDVPVYSDDRFIVSKLEGFISNREASYEDPIEELLYQVLFVSNENSTVADLASTLQADLSQLQAAASFACRLGWAVKVIDPAFVLQDASTSHGVGVPDEEYGHRRYSLSHMSFDGDAGQGQIWGAESNGLKTNDVRVAFVVDANITSYLMMGSVSPGLKSHAVTLYEAGKLGHASIADLCNDLGTLEGAKFEGELQEFANHASSLRCVLQCLLSGGVATDDKAVEICEKMGLLPTGDEESTSLIVNISSNDVAADVGESERRGEANDPMGNTVLSEPVSEIASTETSSYALAKDDSEVSKSGADTQANEKLMTVDDSGVGKETLKKIRKYRVDILRCESLAALPKATLDRLFLRDYDIVVSMVPLPPTAILPGPTGPVHFGPPSHSSMTPWMKLVLYTTVACGPLSVVFMKGQCLRMLPAPLAGCEKALIWSWDGSMVGGIGGKFEGNLVKGNVLLHCLNSLLKYSAVIVLPLNREDLDESGKIVTMDIPLPLKNSDGSVAHIDNDLGLSEEESSEVNSLLADLANKIELWTVGYVRLLKLFKETDADHFTSDKDKHEWVPLSVEFGIPLFNPKLCNNICKRVVSSQLLQADSLTEHHDSMQSIRKRLRDLCTEYQAIGPAAKLLYQKELAKDSAKDIIVNYASGRWNPLIDPSSPISSASSEHQRLKLACRQRNRTEVLSFDGSILRSYALASVYEAATRPVEDAAPFIKAADPDETDIREVVLPGVNLLFDGLELHPFDIGSCLQARQPISLIAEAATVSSSIMIK